MSTITTHYPRYANEKTWEDYDRRIGSISNADLAETVDRLLADWVGMAPPKPGHLAAVWKRIRDERAANQEAEKVKRFGLEPYPGGTSPDGKTWMTVPQAREALVRLKEEHPMAFDESLPAQGPEEAESAFMQRTMELRVHRIMRRGYEKLIWVWEGRGERPWEQSSEGIL